MANEEDDETQDCAPGEVPRTWVPLDDRLNPKPEKWLVTLYAQICALIRGDKPK